MKIYNKQVTTVINANAHLISDSENVFQYCAKSYPGHNIYRDLTESEIKTSVPEVLTQFKCQFRATRKSAIELAIEHLKSDETHENLVEKLKDLWRDFDGARVCSECGVVTKRSDIRYCVDCNNRSALVKVTKEVIFNKFKRSAELDGLRLDVRYKPSAGYRAISQVLPQPQIIVPGDPDMDPPTTKVTNRNYVL